MLLLHSIVRDNGTVDVVTTAPCSPRIYYVGLLCVPIPNHILHTSLAFCPKLPIQVTNMFCCEFGICNAQAIFHPLFWYHTALVLFTLAMAVLKVTRALCFVCVLVCNIQIWKHKNNAPMICSRSTVGA